MLRRNSFLQQKSESNRDSFVSESCICRCLKNKSQYLTSLQYLREIGLPTHNDQPKNWDSLAALSIVAKHFPDKNLTKVMDAGGEYYSVFLHHLSALGYQHLSAVNLAFNEEKQSGSIIYQKGDITSTIYADESWDMITCLSVIEHLNDSIPFFTEAYRILKLNGLLFISTDYWSEKVITDGMVSYENPLKIYDKSGIEELAVTAERNHFKLLDPLDSKSRNKVVSCDGLKYTFIYMTFQKV